MKAIRNLYFELLALLSVRTTGRPSEIEVARLMWEAHVRFWIYVRSALDPRGKHLQWNSSGHSFYVEVPDELPAHEIEESIEQTRQLLALKRLSFGTWHKIRPVLRELLRKAGNEFSGADIAVCAVAEFVRLELGEEPDPEYGSFPERDDPRDRLDDENWFLEDEIDRVIYGDGDRYDDGEHHRQWQWVAKAKESMNDPAKFEERFPGMGHRHSNVVHALRPVFELDDVHDFFAIVNAVEAITKLLQSQFEENMQALPARNLLDFVA